MAVRGWLFLGGGGVSVFQSEVETALRRPWFPARKGRCYEKKESVGGMEDGTHEEAVTRIRVFLFRREVTS